MIPFVLSSNWVIYGGGCGRCMYNNMRTHRIADTRRLCVAVIAVLVLARDTASSLVVESITINALQYEEIYIEIASPSVYTYIKIRFLSFKQVTG